MRRWMIGAAGLCAVAAVPAFAQPAGGPPGGDHPPMQPLTRADVQAIAREHFQRVDTNHDGFISRDEAEAVRGPMGGPMGGPPPGPPGAAGAPPPPPPADGASMPGMNGQMHMRMGGGGMGGGVGLFTLLNGRTFDRADADHDGKVSQAEAEAEAMRLFDRVDLNHDGTISPEERRAARELMRLRRSGSGE